MYIVYIRLYHTTHAHIYIWFIEYISSFKQCVVSTFRAGDQLRKEEPIIVKADHLTLDQYLTTKDFLTCGNLAACLMEYIAKSLDQNKAEKA